LALARTWLGTWLRRVPGLERAYIQWGLQRKVGSHRLCGVYVSRRKALRAIPLGRTTGWDNEAAARIWAGYPEEGEAWPVWPNSYPVFFWLSRLLEPGTAILDYGGSVGLSYYGYRRYRTLPEGASWTIVEVPQIAARGRLIAEREEVKDLFFATDIAAPEACDILLASGSLQYMEQAVPGLLEQRMGLPRYLLLSKVPFAADSFWSLDNFGPAVSPYRVFEEVGFLGYFTEHGYELVDRWRIAEISSDIAFHPEMRMRYHGFCWRRK
jgi:putative methyltransferase (TIGR04325 family)